MRRHGGFTMVELVISIVVIGIAAVGILGVMARVMKSSADPMVQQQAIAIAEAYLEEILTKSFPVLPGSGSRALYDDVRDYNFTDTGAHDQNGNLMDGLGGYNVTTATDDTVTLNGEPAIEITVTVTPPVGNPIVLTGYRTNY